MLLGSKEHEDLMAQFEKQTSGRLDKEEFSRWSKGNIYQDGKVNELFLAFRQGYALAKCWYQLEAK